MTRCKGSIVALALVAILVAPLVGCHERGRDRDSRYDGQRSYERERWAAEQRRRDEAERRRAEEIRRRDRDRDRGDWYRHD